MIKKSVRMSVKKYKYESEKSPKKHNTIWQERIQGKKASFCGDFKSKK